MNSQPDPSRSSIDSSPKSEDGSTDPSEFERLSGEPEVSFVAEFWQFLKEEKRWWLTPIIVACLAITGLAWFTSTGAYPFIYSLF